MPLSPSAANGPDQHKLENLRRALDQHAIVSITDVAGTIIEVNDKFCDISGYARAELLGQNHRLLKSGRYDQAFYADMWETITAGRTWQGEICNRAKDGSEYWVRSTITPFLGQDGLPEYYVSIRTDITYIKATEQVLAEQEMRYRSLVTTVADGILLYRQDGACLECNPAAARILGLERESLLARPLQDAAWAYVGPDAQPLPGEAHPARIALATGRGQRDVVMGFRRPDGALAWLNVSAEPISLPGQEAQGPYGVAVSLTDVTGLRQAEDTLKLFRRLVETTDQAIRVADAAGRIEYVNPAYERLLGYQQAEVAGKDFLAVGAAPGQEELLGQILETLARGNSWRGQLRLRHKGGREFVSLSHLNGIFSPHTGKLLHTFNMFVDYSDEMAQQETLEQAVANANAANRSKSEFLSRMSHELRTPLNAIIGFSSLMELDETLDEDNRDSLQEITRAGRHLLGLINEVLDLAKVEAGRIDLHLEAVDCAALLASCISLMRPLADNSGITLQLEPLPQDIQVRADESRLRQVLLNLVANAIKYNRKNGQVRIWAERTPGGSRPACKLHVTDTGIGINPEQLQQLFQPFNRLGAEYSEVEGTGIGLVITRNLVELMEGQIGVESTPGQGSDFWLELPLAESETPPAAASVPDQNPATATTASPRRLVLYIEDKPANLKLIRQALAHLPQVRLITAPSGTQGLEQAHRQRPDLILLDINLPDMEGHQVLARLRQQPETANIPVIALSANAMPRDIERALAAGFADYLTKPIDIHHFLAVMDKLLQPPPAPVAGR